MRKHAYIQKLSNGVLLTVTDESGEEQSFFFQDSGSAPYRTLAQVAAAAGTGRSAIMIQKLANGFLLHEEHFLMSDDSAECKDLSRAYDTASAQARQQVHAEPEPEPGPEPAEAGQAQSPFNFGLGHEDAAEYDDENPGIFDVGSYYLRKCARVVEQNPTLGNTLGSFLGGLSEMEAKRHAMNKKKRGG